MTVSYTPAQIAPATGSVISAVRFLLQDTDTTAAELTDEEITAIYDTTDPITERTQLQRVYLTAALLAQSLWTRYTRQVSFSSGGASMDLSNRADVWQQTAVTLAAQANLVLGYAPDSVTYVRRGGGGYGS